MWSKAELVQIFVEHERKLLQLLLDYGHRADAPSSSSSAPAVLEYPEPKGKRKQRKDKPRPGSQEWFKRLPPPRNDGISMNSLARAVEKPRPPRRPGMQSQRYNGRWWHY